MDPGTEKETIAEEKRSEKNHEKLEEGNDVDIMIDINDEDLMFADEDLIFSSLPDFPCLSSPTANSSTNLNSNRNPSISSASSSSSSSSSWALFSNEGLAQEAHMQPQNSWRHRDREDGDGDRSSTDEMAKIFLDWLKNNRDSISPEDLRSIKLKKSTIECAAARLGGGKQGRSQLLKLILTWVQNNHLQSKNQPFSPMTDFHSFSPPPPPPIHYPPFPGIGFPQYPTRYNSPYPPMYPHPSPSVGGSTASATKEARKKRMARQRRVSVLNQQRNNQSHSQKSSISSAPPPPTAATNSNKALKNWALLSSARQKNLPTYSAAGSVHLSSKTSNMHQTQLQSRNLSSTSSDKRQGWKSEKNLRFLLRKVLKQSDVGSLGRIVLPKKEAEIHLPELDTRDGISIPMEDIGTSRVWNMKYRFWPNNKSRMYLLENTGDFVRSNGLQEGDFIVIYSDAKGSKYMIRGVKVRQQSETKGAACKLSAPKAHQRRSSKITRNNYDSVEDLSYCSDVDGDENGNAFPLSIMVDDL
ncbi:B3 domain-containing protein VP1-like [Asparagus officinalis]|uniref:B3 domain-containing protein VP1-like n=1 Tax=Asparagus officinalis TaxID=4686 RepID=UPI00098DE461|nr:B3 domain-containing protein VP1-like [Asparagus officinalis]